MFGERLGARRGSQDLVFAAVAERDDGIDCRFALRNGAGLIENDRLDIREDLEGVARAHEDAAFGGLAAAADQG